ncbi:MAG: DUF4956 domain-containing protein [Coriobacteriaceae bacterium]|jgi:uncharacterized membrane protein YhiD involved in acid resistance|nr:DUF4956 domain-containing protein [Coriobacteriaceae bacterium]
MTLEQFFSSIFNSTGQAATVDLGAFVICTLASLVLGAVAAAIYTYRTNYRKDFVVTLALLPSAVQLVIMLVNGNIGAGLAVMGAFTLVRFRSIPGSAKEIAAIFFSMAVGLATGMGFLAVGALFVLIIGAATLLYARMPIGLKREQARQLKITIPESLDFEGLFASAFERHTVASELVMVKTTQMGSLYQLTYSVTLRQGASPKAFLDDIRVRNGNLEVALGRSLQPMGEL